MVSFLRNFETKKSNVFLFKKIYSFKLATVAKAKTKIRKYFMWFFPRRANFIIEGDLI